MFTLVSTLAVTTGIMESYPQLASHTHDCHPSSVPLGMALGEGDGGVRCVILLDRADYPRLDPSLFHSNDLAKHTAIITTLRRLSRSDDDPVSGAPSEGTDRIWLASEPVRGDGPNRRHRLDDKEIVSILFHCPTDSRS